MIDFARGRAPVQRRDPRARHEPGGGRPQPADDLPVIGPRHLAPGDRRLVEDQLHGALGRPRQPAPAAPGRGPLTTPPPAAARSSSAIGPIACWCTLYTG